MKVKEFMEPIVQMMEPVKFDQVDEDGRILKTYLWHPDKRHHNKENEIRIDFLHDLPEELKNMEVDMIFGFHDAFTVLVK